MSGVQITRDGAIMEIMIARPPANAIDMKTSHELTAAFTAYRDDDRLRVAILTGSGTRVFCAGWDLKAAVEHGEDESLDWGPGGFAGIDCLLQLDKPVVAAVNGFAVGGGFELCLSCDLIVAAEHAQFGFPETRIGVLADAGGVQILPRRVPRNIALELLLTGRKLDAGEARQWGLVNAIVPQENMMERAREYASQIARGAPLAVEAIKEVHRETQHLSVRDALSAVRSGRLPTYAAMLESPDHEEGPRAFLEKRDPVWRGRKKAGRD